MNYFSKQMPAELLVVTSGELAEQEVRAQLESAGHKADYFNSFGEAFRSLAEKEYSVLVAERPTDPGEVAILKQIRERTGNPEIVYFVTLSDSSATGASTNSASGELMFVVSHLSHLKTTIELALKHHSVKNQLFSLRGQIAMTFGYDNIIGQSDAVHKIKQKLAKVAETDITILLAGPRGSGRSLAAHALHHHSKHRHCEIVTFDCEDIPQSQHMAGLFGETDGNSLRVRGCLSMADGGTLFIRQIENLASDAQVKLAAFLKTMRLHSDTEPDGKKINLRFIVATSRDLEEETLSGAFNQDLWHQVNVLPIQVPSLTERREDIELLIEYVLRRIAAQSGGPAIGLTPAALDLLRSYHWPGEIKELNSLLTSAAAICRHQLIDIADLGDIGQGNPHENITRSTEPLGAVRGRLAEGQKKLIIKALNENDWNFTQTAQELGIGRTTLWRKVKKYDLKRETAEAKL